MSGHSFKEEENHLETQAKGLYYLLKKEKENQADITVLNSNIQCQNIV